MAGKKLTPSGIEETQITVAPREWLKQEQACIYTASNGAAAEVGKLVMIFSLRSIRKQVAHLRRVFIVIIIAAVVGVDALVINKIDLLPYVNFRMDYFTQGVQVLNPGVTTFPLSCTTGEGLDAWVEWLVQNAKK